MYFRDKTIASRLSLSYNLGSISVSFSSFKDGVLQLIDSVKGSGQVGFRVNNMILVYNTDTIRTPLVEAGIYLYATTTHMTSGIDNDQLAAQNSDMEAFRAKLVAGGFTFEQDWADDYYRYDTPADIPCYQYETIVGEQYPCIVKAYIAGAYSTEGTVSTLEKMVIHTGGGYAGKTGAAIGNIALPAKFPGPPETIREGDPPSEEGLIQVVDVNEGTVGDTDTVTIMQAFGGC